MLLVACFSLTPFIGGGGGVSKERPEYQTTYDDSTSTVAEDSVQYVEYRTPYQRARVGMARSTSTWPASVVVPGLELHWCRPPWQAEVPAWPAAAPCTWRAKPTGVHKGCQHGRVELSAWRAGCWVGVRSASYREERT